jgi:hypothetical protein
LSAPGCAEGAGASAFFKRSVILRNEGQKKSSLRGQEKTQAHEYEPNKDIVINIKKNQVCTL